jgi:hypothetical protein
MTMRTHSESMEVNEAAEGSFGKKWWAWIASHSRSQSRFSILHILVKSASLSRIGNLVEIGIKRGSSFNYKFRSSFQILHVCVRS